MNIKFLAIVAMLMISILIITPKTIFALENLSLPGDKKWGSVSPGPDFVTPVQQQDTYWFDQMTDDEKRDFLSVQCPDFDTVYHNYILDKFSKSQR